MIFYTTLHSAFVDDNTAKYAKPDCILSSSHGTDIVMKDNYYFYFKSRSTRALFRRISSRIRVYKLHREKPPSERHFSTLL